MQVEWRGVSGTLPRYWQTYEWTGYFGGLVLAILFSLEYKRTQPASRTDLLWLAAPFVVILPVLYQYAEYPVRSWDYDCYQIAAEKIVAGESPYFGFYLYPPLLAWVMSVLNRVFGNPETVFFSYQYLQLILVGCTAFQMRALIGRLQADRDKGALLLIGLMVFNIPLWRTIHHNQVNLVLLNILLFSILNFGKKPWLNGLLLAIGVHLKLYPTVIAGIWVVRKQIKPALLFFLMVVIMAIILNLFLPGIWQEFGDFFRNFPGGVTLRDNGLHSIIYNLFYIPGLHQGMDTGNFLTFIKGIYYLAAGVVCLYFLYRFLTRAAIRNQEGSGLFQAQSLWLQTGDIADAGAFMVCFSPMVWEHHYVLTLPITVFALCLKPHWKTWMAAFLIFGMPVADVFLLSLTRIIGLAILLHILSDPAPLWLRGRLQALKPYRTGVLLGGFALIFLSFISRFEHRIFGDGHEYLLQTIAWSRHASPNITQEDTEYLLNHSSPVFRHEYVRDLQHFQKQMPHPQPPQGWIGFYYSLQDELIGYHFPFYALLAVPFKWVLNQLGDDWLKAFSLLNTVLFLLPLFYLFFFSRLPDSNKRWLGVFLFFSPMLWYLRWPHTEVLTASAVALTLLLWTDKRFALSLLVAAIASLQNQPLLLLMLLPLKDLWLSREYGWMQKISLPLPAVVIGLLPMVFFHHHFGVTNLIVHIGSAGKQFITPTRIFDFFLDLNQGLIAGYPMVVILFPLFLVQQFRQKQYLSAIIISGVLLGIAITASMTINWNMGQAGISRYAVWAGMVVLVPVLALSDFSSWILKGILGVGLFAEIFILSSFGMTDAHDGHCLGHNASARWVLNGNPSLYNPEMETFQERSLGREGVLKEEMLQGPLFYIRGDGKATKAIVAQNRLDTCDFGSEHNARLQERLQGLTFQENGFAYIDLIDLACYPKGRPKSPDAP